MRYWRCIETWNTDQGLAVGVVCASEVEPFSDDNAMFEQTTWQEISHTEYLAALKLSIPEVKDVEPEIKTDMKCNFKFKLFAVLRIICMLLYSPIWVFSFLLYIFARLLLAIAYTLMLEGQKAKDIFRYLFNI